jgi:hypothetical protein
MAEEEDKKQEGGEPPPETILETQVQERDPDEAVFAEQAILSYATEALDVFREKIQSGLDGVMAWIDSQANRDALAGGALTARLGQSFLHQMMHACNGHDTPIGAVAFRELDSVVGQAVRNEQDPSMFVNELSRGARDFAWYIRDNLQAVLTNQWDQVRDLAYEGSRDFVPALHALGLPQFSWSAESMKAGMIATGELVELHKPRTQEEALDKDVEAEEQEAEQVLLDEEEKTQQAS